MRDLVGKLVTSALEALQEEGVIPSEAALTIQIERPRDKKHGDFSANAAMVMARHARMNPRKLAQMILDKIPEDSAVERWEIAGPGFLNATLAGDARAAVIGKILKERERFGLSTIGGGKRVQVEFVSANPTGPMHVGHGRGAVIGDAIARLLAATGHAVEKEYYINDAGVQVGVLGRSVLFRYRALFGDTVTIPEGGYPGEYVIDVAKALQERDGDRWLETARSDQAPPEEVVDFAIATVMAMIRSDLDALEIRFDSWFSERTLHSDGKIAAVLERLAAKDLLYEGVLEPPKGKKTDDWEQRPQTLFRSSQFGDETDRPLKKSDGAFTYFAADIAYHHDKAERGFERLIDVWGADHGGYIKRVKAALEALTGRKDILDVSLVQMVNLSRGGTPVRMSKRAGTFVTLREVVDEVGSDAVRFLFLTRSGNAMLDFDLDLAVSRSNDNPVYYVQYAHARVCSVQRQMEEKGLSATVGEDLDRLVEPAENSLIQLLSKYPEVIDNAALSGEPHRLPYYLLDLASAFHTYYNGHRVLEEDGALRNARYSLVEAVRQVINNGLTVLGVSAPERM
ncbi:MAG: arginine--tRNA ligase [Magnetococcales bacterium]|nr:arginine--tRNA ligase [Magnetococcales bacterium]